MTSRSRRLAGKAAIVTGAAGGIGGAIEEAFADEEARIIAMDLPGPIATTRWRSDRIILVTIEPADRVSIAAAFAEAAERLHGIDVLGTAGALRGGANNMGETAL
jgi:NAD(P)-dependent dehydrogenase (short-subunit alcohol dehydrogenase family)